MESTHIAYNISFVFDTKADALLHAEGITPHTTSTVPFPCVPAAGDLICWDWLADGKIFVVVNRLFIWNTPQDVVVQLLLDLPNLPDEQSGL